MAFIRDGTALAYYDPYYGLRIWELEDLLAEHQHITDGYELMLRGMRDGWVMGQDDEPLFWLPVENREGLYAPPPKVLIEGHISQRSWTFLTQGSAESGPSASTKGG